MFGLDEWVAGLGGNGVMAFFVAVLLGLRHATDPDHLTAVSTLVLSRNSHGARRAGLLGFSWGLGHAATLLAAGLPLVLFAKQLPEAVVTGAEVVVGGVIVLLASRLLIRWRRGHYHSHSHSHAGVLHVHPHVHEGGLASSGANHTHSHGEGLGRTPLAAFGIGMVHGIGGSAALGILVVGAASSRIPAVVALVLFAAGTALSMGLVSAAFGYALARQPVRHHIRSLIPILAVGSLIFGAWYTLAAIRGPGLGL